MKIAVFGYPFDKKVNNYIEELFELLVKNKAELHIYEPFSKFLETKKIFSGKHSTFSEPADCCETDCVISIGGDGTLLESVTFIKDKETPILGINAGRLGFLANITVENIPEAIKALFNNDYTFDDRNLIELSTNQDIFKNFNYALNEFAILKRDTSSMIVVHAYLDGEFLNSYWADGLIVSTPTGSTGYSLSCGGPLMMPKTNNFIVAPVNPHNLNVRPMVVSDDSELTFKIEGRSKKFLVSLDSRSKSVDASVELKVKKADFKVRLIALKSNSYFNTLRNKLHWGADARN